MTTDRLQERLNELDAASNSVEARLAAAEALCGEDSLPVEALPHLLSAVEDEGYVDLDWTDYSMVAGGERRTVAERASMALSKIGSPALPAILEGVRRGGRAAPFFSRAVGAMSPDQLAGASRATLDGLMVALLSLPQAPPRQWSDAPWTDGLAAVMWAHGELTQGGDRIDILARRLDHPRMEVSRAAAIELGLSAHPALAAKVLADGLLRPPPPLPLATMIAASASLKKLGGVLDDDRLDRLIAAVARHEFTELLGGLLPALAAHGDRARALAPTLLAWARDRQPPTPRISPNEHVRVRAVAAESLALLVHSGTYPDTRGDRHGA